MNDSGARARDWSGAILGGRYRVVRLLGKGGMGAVYEGLQQDLGRRVALKVLHPHLAFLPDALSRFRFEAQAAAALGHPNIVQVTDFQANPNEPAFLASAPTTIVPRPVQSTSAAPGPIAPIVAPVLPTASTPTRAKVARFSGAHANVYPLDLLRAKVDAVIGATTSCFARFPPRDPNPSFFVTVTARGDVTAVGNENGSTEPRNPSLDQCMAGVFTSMQLGPPQKPGWFRVSYAWGLP